MVSLANLVFNINEVSETLTFKLILFDKEMVSLPILFESIDEVSARFNFVNNAFVTFVFLT